MHVKGFSLDVGNMARRLLLLGLVPAAVACNAQLREADQPGIAPADGEASWVGRHQEELIDAYGSPMVIYDIPPEFAGTEFLGTRENMVSFVYSSTRGDGCIDAYVVWLETGFIVGYHCR